MSVVTSWKLWDKIIDDYQKGVVVNDYPVDSSIHTQDSSSSIGFSLLVIASVQMMTSMIAEKWLPGLHKAMGGDDIE